MLTFRGSVYDEYSVCVSEIHHRTLGKGPHIVRKTGERERHL